MFGVTQFLSRAFTILAFPLSELEAPIPMVLFTVTPIVALLLVSFVKNEVKKEKKGDSSTQGSMQLIVDNSSNSEK